MNLGVGIGLGTALVVLGSQIIDAPWPIGVGIALGVVFGQMAQSKNKKDADLISREQYPKNFNISPEDRLNSVHSEEE